MSTPTEERPGDDPSADTRWNPPAALRAFRHRNCRLFFVKQIISLSGTSMQTVAQS